MIKNIAFLEFYTSNIIHSISYFHSILGFTIYGKICCKNEEIYSMLMIKGNISVILTSSSDPHSEINKLVTLHGDFLYDIAFEVDNMDKIIDPAINSGFKIEERDPYFSFNKKINVIKISTFGNCHHSLIENTNNLKYSDLFSFKNIINLESKNRYIYNDLDHCAIAVNDLILWENRYKGLGFQRTFEETIKTKKTGMDSIVMSPGATGVKFVFVAPIKMENSSQIEKFIDSNKGEGIQHIALLTEDICHDIKIMKGNNVDFLPISSEYYKYLPESLKNIDQCNFEAIKKLGILIDSDKDGYLLQAFTKSLHTRPTFFLELIQREGADSFGKNNIIALFNAVEKQMELN